MSDLKSGLAPFFEARRLHLLTPMRVCLILAFAAVAACGGSPAQQAADARDRAASWAATLQAAADAWASDRVPAHYMASTLDAAAKDLEAEAARVRTSAGPAAAAPLDAVLRAIPSIQSDVAHHDRAATRVAAEALRRAIPVPAAPTQSAAR